MPSLWETTLSFDDAVSLGDDGVSGRRRLVAKTSVWDTTAFFDDAVSLGDDDVF